MSDSAAMLPSADVIHNMAAMYSYAQQALHHRIWLDYLPA
jgi:hypothetical protein